MWFKDDTVSEVIISEIIPRMSKCERLIFKRPIDDYAETDKDLLQNSKLNAD